MTGADMKKINTNPPRILCPKERAARHVESKGNGFLRLDDRTFWRYYSLPSWDPPQWVLGKAIQEKADT